MSLAVALAIMAIAVTLLALLFAVGLRALGLGREVATLEANRSQLEDELDATRSKLATKAEQAKKLEGWLASAEQENASLLEELRKRPLVTRKVHKIFTFGVQGTGKTSLTLKWANPLVQLGAIEPTKKAQYERIVSRCRVFDGITEHVFEIHDFGGEQMVNGLAALVGEEVHGLLFVVDVHAGKGKEVDMERVRQQLAAFQPPAFQYFLGPKTIAACKSVILFINKSDVIPAAPDAAEQMARQVYRPLIEDLLRYAHIVDVRIIVGSAKVGQSTETVFAHFIDKMLPLDARDQTLMQYVQPRDAGMTMPFDSNVSKGPGDTDPMEPLHKSSPMGTSKEG